MAGEVVITAGEGTGGGARRVNFSSNSQDTAHLWQQLLFLELNLFCWLLHFCHMWSRVVFIVKSAPNLFIFPVSYFAFKISLIFFKW